MSYSTVTYTGDGSTQVFAVPFPYINQSDVQVQVSGLVPTFIWLTSTTLQITPAPASGAQVYIFRSTGLASANVVFADGYTLRAADLNSVNTQVLYGLQEAWDQTSAAIAAAEASTGNLPSVTTAQNADVLQVVGGVWTLTTPAGFRGNSGLFPLTTKGDVFTRSATGDTRLGIGANNTVLVADSTQATGNKWAFQPVADTSITSGASGVAVGLAAGGGLLVSSGLLVRGYRVVSADPSPTDGDSWYNSTTKTTKVQEGGLIVSRVGKLFTATADGTIVTNTTSTTASGLLVTIPANFLTVGKTIRIKFYGFYVSVTTPTVSIALFRDAVALDTAPFTCAASGRFHGEFNLTIRSTGVGGTLFDSGRVWFEANTGTVTQVFGQTTTTTIDTTASHQFYIAFSWSAASASNQIRLSQFEVEVV